MRDLDRLKARVAPGDSVRFRFRGRRLRGVVAALGPKYAQVTVSNGDGDGDDARYRVPYGSLEPMPDARDFSAQEQGALADCRRLLCVHGLRGWSARLDDSASRAGACDHERKVVLLSRLFVRAASARQTHDLILHEIAHALAGFEHHHDAVWRKIARGIGGSDASCHDIKFGRPRWIMRCPGGCFALARNRRTRGLFCNRCQRAVRFDAWSAKLADELGDALED
ncbi:MAG: SprT-like domain-containing protein [bacterium]